MTYDLPIILCDYGIDMGKVDGGGVGLLHRGPGRG